MKVEILNKFKKNLENMEYVFTIDMIEKNKDLVVKEIIAENCDDDCQKYLDELYEKNWDEYNNFYDALKEIVLDFIL